MEYDNIWNMIWIQKWGSNSFCHWSCSITQDHPQTLNLVMFQHTTPNVFKVSCSAAVETIPLYIELLLEVLTDLLNHVRVGSRLLPSRHTQLINTSLIQQNN